MSTFYVSPHLYDQLAERAKLDRNSVNMLVKMVSPHLSKFDPKYVHQVAVQVVRLPRAVKVGYSVGDCLIVTADIRTRTITTSFVRYQSQGIPKMAQVYIDLDGKVLQTQPLMSEF